MRSAAGDASADARRSALAVLYETYWRPVYAYARRQGFSPEDAEDLLQEFYARLISHEDLQQADPDEGRFRAWLLTCLKHFVINHRRAENAQKRGGGRRLLSLDSDAAESWHAGLESDSSPEQSFERAWALTVGASFVIAVATMRPGELWRIDLLAVQCLGGLLMVFAHVFVDRWVHGSRAPVLIPAVPLFILGTVLHTAAITHLRSHANEALNYGFGLIALSAAASVLVILPEFGRPGIRPAVTRGLLRALAVGLPAAVIYFRRILF